MKKKLSVCFAVLLLTVVVSSTGTANGVGLPRYVFFFLGDGMANAQIQATEAYLTTINGGSAMKAVDLLKSRNRLNMSKMNVQGMQTTYDSFALMTDSASAGTAFACGLKTKSGTIGMDETLTTSVKSVAQLAHEQGRKVGILTSVSLDHATPASYYASVTNRGYMNNIAKQLVDSGYEFFGGGGFASPTGPARGGDTSYNIWNELAANGYTVYTDKDKKWIMNNLMTAKKDKLVVINPYLQDASAMPYDIDRPATNLSLADMTELAIANLYDGKGSKGNGFFMMVEGGKIDWACHANDAMATIGDMLDFDDAIGVALAFYKKHPTETLIVVTGDHETGGMTIGHATTGYAAYYDRLLDQKMSFTQFGLTEWPAHEAAYQGSSCSNAASDPDTLGDAMKSLMLEKFGLDYATLNDYQKEKLEDAYDQSLCETNNNTNAENTYLYGGYEPITVTITHILNERASIGWTSYSHTGVPVPVYATGWNDWLFRGFYDNTDIAKKLAKAMNLGQLPAKK